MSTPGAPLPPPPPPPYLAPPPGYAGSELRAMGAVALKRVTGLRTAMLVLLGVYVFGTLIQIALIPSTVDSARDLIAGRISDDEFTEDVALGGIAGVLSGGATVALVVLTMVWMSRLAGNHQALGRRLTWTPGWAVGGWFLPPLVVYAIPMLMLRETWKAADPAVPPGDDRWRATGDNPVVWVWWALYGLIPIVFLAAGVTFQLDSFAADTDDVADSFVDNEGLFIAQYAVSIAAAMAWGLLVHTFTRRHTELTGEQPGR